ncbi:Uu.00g005440.m01.CDS01 [Anthostomella pinea]|uniref:Uu.00g005440.m01.CDS01 n=1 Tax=Anthostomella pinea TaxID=933095 RepID=A0AAI8VK25_9PEZI|nr:Uu.00g005440.m01.CDS01 [Anthostomella pinea]
MPYYDTSQEWLRQSALLLEARPSTTRITTKYHITASSARRRARDLKRLKAQQESEPTTTTTSTTTKPPRGFLTLKTFDPHSGTTLKYKTTKAAEVSRLILSLGQLGRRMAALPEPEGRDAVMADAPVATEGGGEAAVVVEEKEKKSEPATTAGKGGQGQGQGQQSGGGGGGVGKGKKKKGKK